MLEQRALHAPRMVDRPRQRVAVLETVGDPEKVGARAIGALYGAAAQLGLHAGPLRARWPNAATHPREEWVAWWALPVADHTPDLGGGIALDTWYGGLTAEVLHEGGYGDEEVQSVRRLGRFVEDCGYEVTGPLEEEYLTQPGARPERRIIRFEVRQSHSHGL